MKYLSLFWEECERFWKFGLKKPLSVQRLMTSGNCKLMFESTESDGRNLQKKKKDHQLLYFQLQLSDLWPMGAKKSFYD